MSNASVPLLSKQTQQQAEVTLTALTRAWAAFEAGKLPSSQQVDALFRRLLNSSLLQPEIGSRWAGRAGGGQLSPSGKQLVEAARGVVQALARVNLEKNEDNKIQRFIYNVRKSALNAQDELDVQIDLPEIELPSTDELQVASESLESLATLLVTSNELRDTINEFTELLRDVFAKTSDQLIEAADETARANVSSAKQQTEAAKRIGRKKGKQMRAYLDEKLPTDVKDELIERFKKIAAEVRQSDEYSDAVGTLTDVARKYAKAGQDLVKEAKEQTDIDVNTGDHANNAVYLFKQIVEAFTGPLDGVVSAADTLATDVEEDERLQKLLDDLHTHMDAALYDDPSYLTSTKAQRRTENLYDRAQKIVEDNDKWRKDANALADELNKVLERAKKDKALDNLAKATAKLTDKSAKFFNKGYSLVDGTAVWADLTQVFLPRLLAAVSELPLPRIEYIDPSIDLVLDGVNFTSASFVPDQASFRNVNEGEVKRGYAAYASSFHTSTKIEIKGLRLEAKDISYWYNKKQGWFTGEDSGLIDIRIGDAHNERATDGLDIVLTVENAKDSDRESFFSLQKVDVSLSNFDVTVHDSEHPIRNWFGHAAIRKTFESRLVEGLEASIADAFVSLDQRAWATQQRAIGAGLAAPDPLTFVRALLTPVGRSSANDFEVIRSRKGLTKVGPQGNSILAIGVDELLLPGKLTGLGRQGKDIVHARQSAERLLEEGRQALDDAEERVEELTEEARAEREETADREAGREGWESALFDL